MERALSRREIRDWWVLGDMFGGKEARRETERLNPDGYLVISSLMAFWGVDRSDLAKNSEPHTSGFPSPDRIDQSRSNEVLIRVR